MELDKYGKEALDLVLNGKSLFITGKAGTGKTTVLREITAQCKRMRKNVVVLSPTGVAAKNAGGVTIHSFLHLPLGPYIPGLRMPKLYSLKEDEIRVVNKVDLIIIDEVSMVRCDLLDEVDDVLRHYRKNPLPFGGIQMVMFGDLYQLMPVAQEEDWEKLKEKYNSPYFFSSKIMEKINCPMFELKIIHRQDDRNFVTLLNNVRSGHVSSSELKELEGRYKKNFIPKDSEGYIRLTTHNWRSKKYNEQRLEELPGSIHEYKAYIEDFFPKDEYPTNYVLRLKRGARVMFIKNDNEYKQYVNGTLGTVVSLGEMGIVVRTDDGEEIGVERQTWDFYRYHINKNTKEIEAELCGSFKQYPLKLAWAVTIHKSQGLTFDKVVIDAGKAFTYGQVYVALSRCRKFHGIVLVSPITSKIIKTDPVVKEYMDSVKRIVIENDEIDDSVKHLSYSHGSDRTLWMINDGLSPIQIAEQSNQRIEIVYSHIAKLIENGDVDISKYVPENLYDSIKKAVFKVADNEKLKEIKERCPSGTKYADIRMVIADLKRKDLEDDNDSEWYFIPNVSFNKTSKRFLSYDCRVVLSTKGYYLEVSDEYIKLGDYPKGYGPDIGNVWIKKSIDNKGLRMVHDYFGKIYLIGYIKEKNNIITFTNPEGKKYTINIEE